MRNVSITEEEKVTYVTVATDINCIEYSFSTFEEAVEALPNIEELNCKNSKNIEAS